jgi:signal peptidase I
MSFPLILVLLVFITGLIWALDKLFWVKSRSEAAKEPLIVEYAKSFFPVLLLVLVIRSFIAEPFRIPSSSMVPTLHIGDFILVNKFSYGVRLPVLNTKILTVGEPERGDVTVFRYWPKATQDNPNPQPIDYIKRVIGLPGDTVGYFDKTLYINGEKIEQQPREKNASHLTIAPARNELKSESLGKHNYEIMLDPMRNMSEGEAVIPEGHYFVMGDNRDNSNDSRFWGPVAEEDLVGKAFFIWMSWNLNEGGIVWERIGTSIE